MIRSTLILLILYILSSCHSNEGKGIKDSVVGGAYQKIQFQFPVIIDSFKPQNVHTLKSIPLHHYHVLYVGSLTDSISVSYKPYRSVYSHYEGLRKRHRELHHGDIQLFVDTTNELYGYGFVKSLNVGKKSEGFSLEETYFRALPVFVFNNCADTLLVGYGDALNFILEVKNQKGKWQALNLWEGTMTGTQAILLPSNHVTLTSVPIFKGSFKTVFRLRFDNLGLIVSNEYAGSIDPLLIKKEIR
ncbi:MAG: hypothetical protein V4590_09950 [Bacteroidota bacterium]